MRTFIVMIIVMPVYFTLLKTETYWAMIPAMILQGMAMASDNKVTK